MLGTIRSNLVVGMFAFVLTFIMSISQNILTTTLLRSLYSFIVMFVLVFPVRFVLGSIAGLRQEDTKAQEEQAAEEQKGQALDLVTPDQDEDLNDMLKQSFKPEEPLLDQEEPSFAPLNPPKLTTKVNLQPEEMAQALRRMSED